MSKEIIDLLESSRMAGNTHLLPNVSYYAVNPEKFDQALTLLKQQPTALNSCPYPPCKGKGKLQKNAGIYYVYCKNCGRHTDSFETNADAIKAWNNTNKPEQPIEGKFTKETRINFTTHFENPDWVIHKKLMEALTIIDSAEARLKELLEALEEAADNFYYIHKHPEDAHTEGYNFMEKINQAKKE